MRTRCNHQKGQSLAVAVVGLMLAAFCFTLLAQAGRLCLERQRADNAADAVALGTAVDYARALNFISLTNKIYALTEIAQILKMIPWTMPFVLWVPPAKTMQRIQDYLAGTGSSLGYGSARLNLGILGELAGMNLAQANGLQAVILWNGDENESPSLIPSLNLKRRCSDDAAPDQDSSQGQSQGNGQGSQPQYSYQDHSTGQVIEVDGRYVQEETYLREDGKAQTVYRYEHGKNSSRFVSKKEGQGKPLDIAETGPHRVTVVGLRTEGSGLPTLFVCAKAEAGGGSMAVWDVNGAGYEAYLIPCTDGGGVAKWDPSNWKLPSTGLAPLDSLLQSLAGPLLDRVRSLVPTGWQVLH
jgi:hypothetical protein